MAGRSDRERWTACGRDPPAAGKVDRLRRSSWTRLRRDSGGPAAPECAWTRLRRDQMNRLRWDEGAPDAPGFASTRRPAPKARSRSRAEPVHLTPEGFTSFQAEGLSTPTRAEGASTSPGRRPLHPTRAAARSPPSRPKACPPHPRRRRVTVTCPLALQARRPPSPSPFTSRSPIGTDYRHASFCNSGCAVAAPSRHWRLEA